MLYTILCYKPAGDVESWSQEKDDAVMAALYAVEEKLTQARKLGPIARLMPTKAAKTLLKGSPAKVVDGPFAETKEHLLGFYVVDVADQNEAIEVARDLGQANPGGSYEVRPVALFRPDVVAA